MNNKKLPRIATSAIFLAIVLVGGTFAAISPSSFMADVQAQREYDVTYNNYENDYGKDNNSYKSNDNKIVKKVNCNNIDVNVNGLELSGLPPALSGLLTGGETDEGERDVNSYGSYGGSGGEQQSGYDNNKNSFKFVCINNNNNTVIGGGEPEPISQICEECFAVNSTLQTAILDLISDIEGVTITGLSTTDGVNEIGESLTFGPQIDTIEKLCTQIENAPVSLSAPLSDELIRFTFVEILGEEFEDGIEQLIECLLEAGIIVDRELPPIEICDNGIDDDGDGLVDSEDPECLL